MDLADVPRHRPLAFDKMESLIKEMQEAETGVPVRSQKLFLTFIPSAFMGYDLVEWLMDRFNMEDNIEAINMANQLCQYGYFFPVNDSKNLTLKDDSSLYRFQSPYYWPWAAMRASGSGGGAGSAGGGAGGTAPASTDNLEYAIYLVKRTLRNKQRHGLEDYELEALASLRKNLAAKWDLISMQADQQVRLAKDRKKGDKIVSDSQERAYWRVARPPPGLTSALEACPVPARSRVPRARRKPLHHLTKETELLRASLERTRVKVSVALESLLAYSETYVPWDPWLTPPQPSNPWVTDDTIFWQINSPLVETPTEKRLQRWALSMEELVSDPSGLQEFTAFLRKEYSHENIRFWLAVVDLRRGAQKHVSRKLNEIYDEFLRPGAPCEINIDGATKERVAEALRSGSRFALDHAAEHVYSLLLKKDCYPRFVRSDHFRALLAAGKNVQLKKRFFGFGGPVKKKSTGSGPEPRACAGPARRRGSDRSLSGSAHELAACGVQPAPRVPHAAPHSHSQSNLVDLPYSRDTDDEAAPWECAPPPRRRKDSVADSGSSSSDVSGVGVGERVRRLPQQSTLDGGLRGAPPPLRRLSAVEPRHLAPLCSPPRSPPPPPSAPTERTIPAPHPTPTISVSSAPDESAESPSPERATRTVSREPSLPELSEATPPHVRRAHSSPSPSVSVADTLSASSSKLSEASVSECSSVLSRDKANVDKPSVDVAPEPAVAANAGDEVDTKSVAAASVLMTQSSVDNKLQAKTPAPSGTENTPSLPVPSDARSTSCVGATTSRVSSATSYDPPAISHDPPVTSCDLPACARTAPLAESEDAGPDDDNLDKVPSAPRDLSQARSDASLHNVKEEKHTSDSGRNDVCPWEDESFCDTEADAPFVKTYATLGYL